MNPRSAGSPLVADLDLLERVGWEGGLRDLAALTVRVDDWLDFDRPIRLPDGGLWPEPGHLLLQGDEQAWWLLRGGRLLVLSEAPGDVPRLGDLVDLAELGLDTELLAAHLRPILITRHIGGTPLVELSGAIVPPLVAELLATAWACGATGREAIFRLLANAMRSAPGWTESTARLKAGFERGLSDRARPVRAVAARALVHMAAGLLPSPPAADPRRILSVMLHMPRDDVKADVLAALLELAPSRLDDLADTLEPLLREASALADPEARRLAGELQLRLAGGAAVWSIARELGASDPGLRRQAIERLAAEPQRQVELLLPKALDAIEDPDPTVRGAALALLQPRLAAIDAELRTRVLATLLHSDDPRAVELAVAFLSDQPEVPGAELRAALREALDGPTEARNAVARLWIESHRQRSAVELAEGYRVLLHHADPVLRQALLRDLVRRPPERQTVRDALFKLLVERLQDEESSLRLEAARSIVALDYPHATEIVGQLVFDRDRYLRRAAGQLLDPAREPRAAAALRDAAAAVETLFDLASAGDGDARQAWSLALRAISSHPSARVPGLLAALLALIPADTGDPFLRFAIAELDAGILRRMSDVEDLLALCRRLIEPPDPQPEHALRLAGTLAAEDPRAFDFLWTCYQDSGGQAVKAAERALASLASSAVSEAVLSEVRRLEAQEPGPAAARLLDRFAG